jgi:hypothetical protein
MAVTTTEAETLAGETLSPVASPAQTPPTSHSTAGYSAADAARYQADLDKEFAKYQTRRAVESAEAERNAAIVNFGNWEAVSNLKKEGVRGHDGMRVSVEGKSRDEIETLASALTDKGMKVTDVDTNYKGSDGKSYIVAYGDDARRLIDDLNRQEANRTAGTSQFDKLHANLETNGYKKIEPSVAQEPSVAEERNSPSASSILDAYKNRGTPGGNSEVQRAEQIQAAMQTAMERANEISHQASPDNKEGNKAVFDKLGITENDWNSLNGNNLNENKMKYATLMAANEMKPNLSKQEQKELFEKVKNGSITLDNVEQELGGMAAREQAPGKSQQKTREAAYYNDERGHKFNMVVNPENPVTHIGAKSSAERFAEAQARQEEPKQQHPAKATAKQADNIDLQARYQELGERHAAAEARLAQHEAERKASKKLSNLFRGDAAHRDAVANDKLEIQELRREAQNAGKQYHEQQKQEAKSKTHSGAAHDRYAELAQQQVDAARREAQAYKTGDQTGYRKAESDYKALEKQVREAGKAANKEFAEQNGSKDPSLREFLGNKLLKTSDKIEQKLKHKENVNGAAAEGLSDVVFKNKPSTSILGLEDNVELGTKARSLDARQQRFEEGSAKLYQKINHATLEKLGHALKGDGSTKVAHVDDSLANSQPVPGKQQRNGKPGLGTA